MKTINKFLLSTLGAASLFALAGTAQAQFKPAVDDGIAASPRLRQILDDRHWKTAAPSDHATAYHAATTDGIAASPKTRQNLADRGASGNVLPGRSQAVGYAATGSDGITASPKARQMLNERGANFQIAPVK